jgi:RimJ/RimL family protein N-acetyltransferase
MYQAVLESIDEVSRWLAWCHPGYSLEESAAWVGTQQAAWANGSEYSFAITNAADGTYLGTIGLNRIDPIHRWANLGYWVRSSQTNKGVATASALLVARFAFEHLKLNRIEIVISVKNTSSLRVAEKIGAAREGLLRSKVVAHGEVHDAVMFSLIPQDFVENPKGRGSTLTSET